MNDIKKKNIILSIVVIMIGLMFTGGTYAYLTLTVNTTNSVYNAKSLCFLVDYNTTEIETNVGTNLFSSLSETGGVGTTVNGNSLIIDRTGLTGDTYKRVNISQALVVGHRYVIGFDVSGLDSGETTSFGVYFSGSGIISLTELVNGYNTISFENPSSTSAYFTLDMREASTSENLTVTLSNFIVYEQNQNISGVLFPSGNITGGLNGHVGLKRSSSCTLNGVGTIKLHINNGTSSKLMTRANSYCEDRSTLEAISGVSTQAACTTAGGRWRGYGDPYCESTTTLERIDYKESDCASHGGTWVTSSLSPLKYAIYDNAELTGNPVAKNHIPSSAIGGDFTLMDSITIDNTQKYYYIYIWLDGYQTDSSYADLPFSGYIKADAIQSE